MIKMQTKLIVVGEGSEISLSLDEQGDLWLRQDNDKILVDGSLLEDFEQAVSRVVHP